MVEWLVCLSLVLAIKVRTVGILFIHYYSLKLFKMELEYYLYIYIYIIYSDYYLFSMKITLYLLNDFKWKYREIYLLLIKRKSYHLCISIFSKFIDIWDCVHDIEGRVNFVWNRQWHSNLFRSRFKLWPIGQRGKNNRMYWKKK